LDDLRFRLGRGASLGSAVAAELFPTNRCTMDLHFSHLARIICTPRRLVKLSGFSISTDSWHLTQYPEAGFEGNATSGMCVTQFRKKLPATADFFLY
jgi:hypothetical protein